MKTHTLIIAALLTAFAGTASAEMSLSGSARMGVKIVEGTAAVAATLFSTSSGADSQCAAGNCVCVCWAGGEDILSPPAEHNKSHAALSLPPLSLTHPATR